MNRLRCLLTRRFLGVASAVAMWSTAAHAVQMPFVLDGSNATLQAVNPQSDFYKLEKSGSESGSGAAIFDFVFGSDGLGEFVQLTWGLDPKPFLTGAGLKAGGSGSAANGLYAMIWGAEVFAAFNESDAYDAIRLYQDGIVHKRNGQSLGISHVTLSGDPGQPDVQVPDSGSALGLLAVGLVAVFFFRGRFGRAASDAA